MDKFQAVELATKYIEAQGFELAAISNLSEACYLQRPGKTDKLRVAAHPCRHPAGIAGWLTIEYREAWERDEDRVAWIRSASDLYRECDLAIAEYDAGAQDDEEAE